MQQWLCHVVSEKPQRFQALIQQLLFKKSTPEKGLPIACPSLAHPLPILCPSFATKGFVQNPFIPL
jgi:hypothetical protein